MPSVKAPTDAPAPPDPLLPDPLLPDPLLPDPLPSDPPPPDPLPPDPLPPVPSSVWLSSLFESSAAMVFLSLRVQDRKSTRLNSSHPSISYAVFCLKKKKKKQ